MLGERGGGVGRAGGDQHPGLLEELAGGAGQVGGGVVAGVADRDGVVLGVAAAAREGGEAGGEALGGAAADQVGLQAARAGTPEDDRGGAARRGRRRRRPEIVGAQLAQAGIRTSSCWILE